MKLYCWQAALLFCFKTLKDIINVKQLPVSSGIGLMLPVCYRKKVRTRSVTLCTEKNIVMGFSIQHSFNA